MILEITVVFDVVLEVLELVVLVLGEVHFVLEVIQSP